MSTKKPRRRGRPPCCPRELALRIIQLKGQDLSCAKISNMLNAEGVPTPTGRPRWTRYTVDRVLKTQYVRDLIEEMCISDTA